MAKWCRFKHRMMRTKWCFSWHTCLMAGWCSFWYMNGNPCSLQTLELVEQGNGVVERKIRVWKMEHGSANWDESLLEVALAINTQIYSATSCTPYSIVFRHPVNFKFWLLAQERKEILTDGMSHAMIKCLRLRNKDTKLLSKATSLEEEIIELSDSNDESLTNTSSNCLLRSPQERTSS